MPKLKLLGGESDDIDVVIDDMTGVTFGELFLRNTEESRKGIDLSGRVAVIERNPEQSKHLETARVHVYNLWLDFCNLRSEEYASDSRIPQIKFGTPLEDAQRRDLTVNSLFYNIHTECVEDWTGMGFMDIEKGLIRTPLDPFTTFSDDPLRILRCIRFSSRLGFEIERGVERCIRDEVPHDIILSKVSKERIGKELFLMLEGNAPFVAMEKLLALHLYHCVFYSNANAVLSSCVRIRAEGDASAVLEEEIPSIDAFLSLVHRSQRPLLLSLDKLSGHETAIFILSLLLYHTRGLEYSTNPKKRKVPLSSHILLENIKAKKSLVAEIARTLEGSGSCISLMEKWSAGKPLKRSEEGIWIRNVGPTWLIAMEVARLHHSLEDKNWVFLRDDMISQGLSVAWEIPKLLNGKEICSLLGIRRPGPQIGLILDAVVKWQLDNPEGTDEECKLWLREEYSDRDS